MTKRPIIEVPLSRVDIVLELVAAAAVAFMVLALARYYAVIPERIATHFGFSGKPDGWGPKSTVLVMLAVAGLGYLLLTIVARFPQTFNYPVRITEENALRQYAIALSTMRWLKAEVTVMCAYIEWQMIRIALGRAEGLGLAFAVGMPVVILATVAILIIRSLRAR